MIGSLLWLIRSAAITAVIDGTEKIGQALARQTQGQHGENDHGRVQRERLDHGRRALMLDVEDETVLRVKHHVQQARVQGAELFQFVMVHHRAASGSGSGRVSGSGGAGLRRRGGRWRDGPRGRFGQNLALGCLELRPGAGDERLGLGRQLRRVCAGLGAVWPVPAGRVTGGQPFLQGPALPARLPLCDSAGVHGVEGWHQPGGQEVLRVPEREPRRREHLGYAGRRVLVSRKWSGKTLADHRAERKNWLLATLGKTATDPARYAWEPVAPGDPDYMEHARRLLHVVADRQQWQTALNEARRRAGPPNPDLPAEGRAA